MTADPKVSPRPWRYRETVVGWNERIGLYDASHGRIADLNGGAESVVAHIVRCVNAHDGLVEALSNARAWIGGGIGPQPKMILAKIDAALAAAKEGA